jgi:cytokinesis protein
MMPGTSGLMAPPPPPPPMPGKMSGNFLGSQPAYNVGPTLGLPVARPKKKLKALHWEKVDTPMTTHWAAHAPTADDREKKYAELSRKGVFDEVEKLFSAKEIRQLGKGGAKKSDKKQIISSDLMRTFRKHLCSLLTTTLLTSLEISLAKFSSYPIDKIVQMIIHCDKEVLDNPVVMDFLQKEDMCNIPENTAKLMAPYSKDWTGPDANKENREMDPAELTREDQIYLQTAFELHHYWKSRMRALALTRTFEIEYDEISIKLKQIVSASENLRDSVSFMNILGLILDIGNYMNDSNKQATGFKLSSLARLGMVKDDKNESNFADMVERIVRTQYPEWEGFTEDLAGVITVQKLNVEQLQQDARRYIDNIKNVQMSLDSGNLSDPKKFHPQDRVSQIVQRSMKDARRKAEQMQLYLEDMSRTFDDIMAFFGEDSSDENARREFFLKLANFVSEWKKSKEKNMALEAVRKRNEASMKRKHAQLKVNGSSDGSAPSSPISTGAMDSLLEKLRAAAPQARDQRDRRRRARLQNKHQVRVASGQQIPEPDEIPEAEAALKSPESVGMSSDGGGLMSPDLPVPKEGSEDDIAERAALLLQGMRGADGAADDVDAAERRDSMRRARRRDNAEEERKARRRRREKASSVSEPLAEAENTLQEEGEEPETPIIGERLREGGMEGKGDADGQKSPTVGVVVSPPSPEGSRTKPIELDDD